MIESIRFITSNVALLIAHGHIEYLDHRSGDGIKLTFHSLVTQQLGGRWLFTACQNTPLGGPWPGAHSATRGVARESSCD
ncbi:hypothetical protein AADR41_29620 [Streptomyces sp. CLV115]|uniref:hypothetical protein n=1 Tax=Streptomyces sp. CLV115 TaxID=3138502 RepID=UPI00313E9212